LNLELLPEKIRMQTRKGYTYTCQVIGSLIPNYAWFKNGVVSYIFLDFSNDRKAIRLFPVKSFKVTLVLRRCECGWSLINYAQFC